MENIFSYFWASASTAVSTLRKTSQGVSKAWKTLVHQSRLNCGCDNGPTRYNTNCVFSNCRLKERGRSKLKGDSRYKKELKIWVDPWFKTGSNVHQKSKSQARAGEKWGLVMQTWPQQRQEGIWKPKARAHWDNLATAPVPRDSYGTPAAALPIRQASGSHSASTSHLPALPSLLMQQCQGRSHTSAIATAHMWYVFRIKY